MNARIDVKNYLTVVIMPKTSAQSSSRVMNTCLSPKAAAGPGSDRLNNRFNLVTRTDCARQCLIGIDRSLRLPGNRACFLQTDSLSMPDRSAEVFQTRQRSDASPEDGADFIDFSCSEDDVNSNDGFVEICDKKMGILGYYKPGEAIKINLQEPNAEDLFGGNTIHLNKNKTTTVIGSYLDVARLMKLKVHQHGENCGGVNVFSAGRQWHNLKKKHAQLFKANPEKFWHEVKEEFWEKENKPWLLEAVNRRDRIRLLSNPDQVRANNPTSGFVREVNLLSELGYNAMGDGSIFSSFEGND